MKGTGGDYKPLASTIKAIGTSWYRLSDSAWLVNTTMNPVQIKEVLIGHLCGRDELFVVGAENCAGYLSADAVYWVEENINSKDNKKIKNLCQQDK